MVTPKGSTLKAKDDIYSTLLDLEHLNFFFSIWKNTLRNTFVGGFVVLNDSLILEMTACKQFTELTGRCHILTFG